MLWSPRQKGSIQNGGRIYASMEMLMLEEHDYRGRNLCPHGRGPRAPAHVDGTFQHLRHQNKEYLVDVRRVCWRSAADSPGLDVPTGPPQLHLEDREGRHQLLYEGHVDRHRNLNVSAPKHRQASNSKAKTFPL